MSRGRSRSPKRLDGEKSQSPVRNVRKLVAVAGLGKNVHKSHLEAVFRVYGEIKHIDLPVFTKSGQNRGKAVIEYDAADAASTAVSHMHQGQLDGAVLKVELTDRSAVSRSSSPKLRYNGKTTRSRSPMLPPRKTSRGPPGRYNYSDRDRDAYRRLPAPRRPTRNSYYPGSRSRSPLPRRATDNGPSLRRRSPSYDHGRRTRTPVSSRSRSSSHGRVRSRSRSYSRSRSRSRSYSSYTRSTRSPSRSRSRSASPRRHRSESRDDIRDSRSRSRTP